MQFFTVPGPFHDWAFSSPPAPAASAHWVDHSRSTSLWTAPSPSQVLRSSPPSYPLPRYPRGNRDSPVVSSTAPHHKSNNSAYFTAWGSPDETRIPSGSGPPKYMQQRDRNSLAADGSPLQIFKHTGSARPSVGNLSPLAAQRSRYGYTQNWLQTSLAEPNPSERGNWWSDESDCSPSVEASCKAAGSPESTSDWLSLSSVVKRERATGRESVDLRVTHSAVSSGSFQQERQKRTLEQPSRPSPKMLASKSANPRVPPSPSQSNQKQSDGENAPSSRPAHFDRTVSEAPVLSSAQDIPNSPPKRLRASTLDSSSFQRPKKRVPWRGKACIIALPLENGIENHQKTAYLKPGDMSDRLRYWEDQGYDTTGFRLCSQPQELLTATSEGQSRAIFPSPTDEHQERESRNYRVSIPDRLEWEEYVTRLKEEKLRALGVSFSIDDSSTNTTPAIPTMSRNVSTRSSSIAMSPIITSLHPSNAGQFMIQFSHNVPRIPSANSHQPTDAKRSHFPNYSIAVPSGSPAFAFSHPQSTPPLAGPWSPQQQYLSQPTSRVMSPNVNGHAQNMNKLLSPVSPMSPINAIPAVAQDPRDLFAHMQKEQARLQAHHLAQQHQQQQLLFARSSSGPLKHSHQNQQLHPALYASQPEIASPIPRGHRQNLSETLSREIEDAELSSAAFSKGEHEIDESPPVTTTAAQTDHDETSWDPLAVDGIKADLPDAELETNPSLSGTPVKQEDNVAHGRSGHRSKGSISGLNATAPVFEYPLQKAPASEVFAFLGDQSSKAEPDSSESQTGEAPRDSSQTKLNVEAPVFVPTNAPKPIAPSREFSFSSSGPVFKPGAPVTKPGGSGGKGAENLPDLSAEKESEKKIFGNIDFSEVIKPVKKSRAIPIVKPASDSGVDIDGQEDESGRITQPEGRQKRMRRHDGDGDQIPLFATPNPATVSACLEPVNPLNAAHTSTDKSDPLEKTTHQLGEIVDDLPTSKVSSLSAENEDLSAPFSFSNAQEAASFSAALPLASPLIEQGKDVESELPHATLYAEKDFPIEPILSASSLPENVGIPDGFTGDSIPLPADAIPHDNDSQHMDPLEDREGFSGSFAPSNSSSQRIELGDVYHANPVDQAAIGDTIDIGTKPAMDGVTYIDPSYQEIDEVMKHLNDEDSDLGVERNLSPWRPRSPIRAPITRTLESSADRQPLPALQSRSDAPSPSPNRLQQTYQYLPPTESESADTADVEMVARNARFSPSYRPSRTDIHRLNSPGSQSISDWDDAVSSVDELQLQARTTFFDSRVDELIGSIVKQNMGPLEKTLASIQASLTTLSSRANSRRPRKRFSDDVEHSDADDEEDGASTSRMKSPLRDRKFEKLKASIQEIAIAQQNLAPVTQLAEVIEAVKDLKSSMHQAPNSTSNIKNIVEEAVGRQLRGRSGPITSSHESATAEKSQLHIAGLESMLKIAETRAEDELKARRATEDALADSQRLLRSALQEAAEQRESAEETERSLTAFHEERHEGLRRTAMLEGSQESLQKTATELSEKNAALEDTLEEYRLSSTQWRTEIDDERAQNKDLNRTIDALRSEMDEGIRSRESLRDQFARLQDDMVQMSNDVVRDQSVRHTKEEELKSKLEVLGSRLEAEARTRERLEAEIGRLEVQEKETMKARFMFEQAQRANAELEALVGQLRSESYEHQMNATRFEREVGEAREIGKAEVQRTRTTMEADVEVAKSQMNIVRADLEGTIGRLQGRLDGAITDAETGKARHELMLEEASDSRNQALREAAEAREAALQEHYRFHERTLGELRSQHERALSNAVEDMRRSEANFNERLALADEKVLHYTDKVAHLEEKLEIAKSAAHAAVQAAQSKKSKSSPSAARESWSKAVDVPEKVSPQALRESILVLQEQLQEREGRIENLEQELSLVDRNAPAKIKDQDMEITWLRELLGVRIDELEHIIQTLSQPVYNRETVKDAAIRLHANLQMEQQEKERAMAGGQTFPSLSSLSNLAASPRALPLAAAAAWGNWRKARETPFSSLSAMANGSSDQTPSRSSPSSSFLSGLLTPPNTNRQTPPLNANGMVSRPSSSSRRPAGPYSTPRQSFSVHDRTSPLKLQASPVTPPLMRKASYDQDAESADFDEDSCRHAEADEEPFGPNVGTILATT